MLALLQLQVDAKDEDYSGDGGDSSGAANAADIYEPDQQAAAVEDEVERSHHQNSLEAGDGDVVATTAKLPPALATEASQLTASAEENTAAEEMEDAPTQKQETKVERPANNSQEYYYDEMHDEEEQQQHDHHREHHKEQHPEEPQQPTVATTTVPEYVRKPKAERFPPSQSAQSDYIEDDTVTMEQHTPQPQTDHEEEIIYHDEPAQPQAHTDQQLPTHKTEKPFKHSSVEYYYDDEMIESTERRGSTTGRTTTEPSLQAGFNGWLAGTSASIPAANSPTTTTTATTSTTTTTTTTTTTAAPRKQTKTIHLVKPELLPADQLRNYIKDVYIRMPLAVIVDPSAASLDQTKRLYIDALQDKNINIKIVLVTLNGSSK